MARPPLSERVAAEARRWLGTPYHHAADARGVGVDCAMLIVRSFVDVGAIEPFDPRPYPRDWMMHRDEERFLGWARRLGEPRAVTSALDAHVGDVVLFRFGRCVSHGGIVTEPGFFMHAFQPAGRVERCELSWNPERFAGAFRVRGEP